MSKMVLVSPHEPAKVLSTLEREMDRYPSVLRTLLTLNAHYFAGNAPVCGRLAGGNFEMRNRRGPFLSLRARGTVVATTGGSEIVLVFSRPPVPDLIGILVRRYDRDLEVMLDFMRRTVGATPHPDAQSQRT